MENKEQLLLQTRRHFFGKCGLSLGSMALLWLVGDEQPWARGNQEFKTPLAPKPPHFPAKAKSVIYLFMAGGPSHLELFDYKPKLQEYDGRTIPESYVKNKRFAFIRTDAKLLGTQRKFRRYGQSGAEVSELLPHISSIVDDIAIIKSMKTDEINHGPAKIFMNTGSPQFGRPSMGAWITYGIGSESQNLPGFVIALSGPRGPRGGTSLYASGFLPTTYQGVPLRAGTEPILDLSNPKGITHERQRRAIDAITDLNAARFEDTGDSEIATRISSYEMAFRMQTSAPELINLADESPQTLALYGVDPDKPSFARNCLLARRLVERGVRFVQLYHTDWDHHGTKGLDLGESLQKRCWEVDQASAALVRDLKARGLLDQTLIIWGGEFGRTPMGEVEGTIGRDHHIDAFSIWMAGGGIKSGVTIGASDELGFSAVEDPVHVHDLQATILHLLGLDHLKLIYRFQGRDFRLTDVGGNVVKKLLA